MIKIGIVNKSNYDYNFESIDPMYKLQGVQLINYCDTADSRLTNFFRAINSDELDFVWFLTGGTLTIDILSLIYIPIFKSKKTRLIGASDATHAFIYFKDQPYIEKYYYLNFLDFLKSKDINRLLIAKFLMSPADFDRKTKEISKLDSEMSIIGGHSIICAANLHHDKSFSNQKIAYFWEHHGAKLETIKYFRYWLKVLANDCRCIGINDIIIGYSQVFDDEKGTYLSYIQQQVIVRSCFDSTNINILFVDQSIYPVRLYL
jgi:muramoyltetrapeptide carboxypeptidase LdcA involved in peptidoglycan recycling